MVQRHPQPLLSAASLLQQSIDVACAPVVMQPCSRAAQQAFAPRVLLPSTIRTLLLHCVPGLGACIVTACPPAADSVPSMPCINRPKSAQKYGKQGRLAFPRFVLILPHRTDICCHLLLQKRSIATGLGLTAASMLMAQNADAAADVAQIAQKAGDNRILAVAALLTPALGWVLFNIGVRPCLTMARLP